MKRLLLLLSLILPAFASSAEHPSRGYNVPSLKFLSARELAKHKGYLEHIASMPFKESQLNKEAVLKLEKIETAPLAKELKDYANFMEKHQTLFSNFVSTYYTQDEYEFEKILNPMRLEGSSLTEDEKREDEEKDRRNRKRLAAQHAQDTQTMLIDACRTGNLDEQLLDDLYAINPKLDLNWVYDKYLTPLGCAASQRNIPLIELLLNHGADVNFNRAGVLPAVLCALDDSCANEERTLETLKTLHAHGAKLDIIGHPTTRTPLIDAVFRKSARIVQFILENGGLATINHQHFTGRTALMFAASLSNNNEALKVLLKYNPQLELTGDDGTAFSIACDRENYEAMELLAQAGANINYLNPRTDRTPLFSAVLGKKNKVVAKLLEYGADIEMRNNINNTPLIIAARDNNLEAIDLLLARGAQIYARGHSEKIALFAALENKNFKAAYKLITHNAQPIPTRDPMEYFSGLARLAEVNTPETVRLMNLLLRKGILNSFENYPDWKNTLLSGATPAMQKLIKSYRNSEYLQSSWISRMRFDAQQLFNYNRPEIEKYSKIALGGAALSYTLWYFWDTFRKNK